MSKLQKMMIVEAVQKFGRIEPCFGKSIEDCFTTQNGKLLFWFNDSSHSTRAIMKPVDSAFD